MAVPISAGRTWKFLCTTGTTGSYEKHPVTTTGLVRDVHVMLIWRRLEHHHVRTHLLLPLVSSPTTSTSAEVGGGGGGGGRGGGGGGGRQSWCY